MDGRQLLQMYLDLGLRIHEADNSVETGLYRLLQRLSSGRLKVFKSLSQWFAEFRLYRRDENGKVVKERDHLCDCTRYLCMELLSICRTEPRNESQWPFKRGFRGGFGGGGTWMG